MNIQIDHSGNISASDNTKTILTGIMMVRQRQKIIMEIGSRVSVHALLAAGEHIRSLKTHILVISNRKTYLHYFDKNPISASEACLGLGRLALMLIERKYNKFRTIDIDVLQMGKTRSLSPPLYCLSDLRLLSLDTSTALAKLSETDMQETAFIAPQGGLNFKFHKLPQNHQWPAPCPYLPLPVEEIMATPYHLWFKALYQMALSVRRPLLHRCEMFFSHDLGQNIEEASEAILSKEDELMPEMPRWHEVHRILYPLAAKHEKPNNFRLLTIAVTLKNSSIIL